MTRQAKEWKFGVEIETFAPAHANLERSESHLGDGIQINFAPTGWGGKRDGSIRPDRGFWPIEIVSPILAGEDGITQVWYILDYLASIGARVNDSTGLHIHIDATGLTTRQIRRIVKHFERYELAFYGLCGAKINDRLSGYYSAPTWVREEGSRYRSINLTNIGNSRKNTIEFRVFAGSLNPEVVITTVAAVLALASYAIRHADLDETVHPTAYNHPRTAATALVQDCFTDATNLITPDREDYITVIGTLIAAASRVFNAGLVPTRPTPVITAPATDAPALAFATA